MCTTSTSLLLSLPLSYQCGLQTIYINHTQCGAKLFRLLPVLSRLHCIQLQPSLSPFLSLSLSFRLHWQTSHCLQPGHASGTASAIKVMAAPVGAKSRMRTSLMVRLGLGFGSRPDLVTLLFALALCFRYPVSVSGSASVSVSISVSVYDSDSVRSVKTCKCWRIKINFPLSCRL